MKRVLCWLLFVLLVVGQINCVNAIDTFSINNLSIIYPNNSGEVVVSGSISSGINKQVVVLILPQALTINDQLENFAFESIDDVITQFGVSYTVNNIAYMNQKTTKSINGEFSFFCKMPDSAIAGLYNIYIGGTKIQTPIKRTFNYITEASINQFAVQLGLDDANTIFEKLKNPNNSEVLSILKFDFTNFNKLTQEGQNRACVGLSAGADTKKPYNRNNVYIAFNQAVLVEMLNEENDEDLFEQIIKENIDNIFIDSSLKPRYNKLSSESKKQADLFIKNSKPVTLYKSLTHINNVAKEFIVLLNINDVRWGDMLDTIKENNDVLLIDLGGDFAELSYANQVLVSKEVAGKGFTSIAAFRQAFIKAISDVKAMLKKAERPTGGGGSSSIIISPIIPSLPPVNTPSDQKSIFNDIVSVSWATESINILAEKNIISGRGNGIFAPNENVTREEFMKMLLSALRISETKAQVSFYDVNESDWFYSYVASAQTIGITQGVGNGYFGIGIDITRQDMAVFVYRASLYAKLQLNASNQKIDFKDAQTISEYAVESIATLQQAGIVNGVGESVFAPLDKVTRAQAAKIIHNLIKIL